jgi:hypothetical protein
MAERKEDKGKLEFELSWTEKLATAEEKLEVTAGASSEQPDKEPIEVQPKDVSQKK